MENGRAEIWVDTRIRTDILIKNNRPDIFIYNKNENEIILVEVGIMSQDNLQSVKTKKKRYGHLSNELGLLYKAKTKIIPYVMTWNGVVTKYYRNYLKKLSITSPIEAIQSKVLKKIVGLYHLSIEEAMRMKWA
ncbi:hypothetical protein TCON_1845 [Astathelohania contejeani]|uniref:Type I restriction enzyme R protein N-terminal domain-containing protein n=1 Tax=Astathelohania contejeani TaxID=164912 RepID=A0ABQ7HXQ3_9MICR|nr:hypothetical protein TCON_1845 [Thelohania contejeani]